MDIRELRILLTCLIHSKAASLYLHNAHLDVTSPVPSIPDALFFNQYNKMDDIYLIIHINKNYYYFDYDFDLTWISEDNYKSFKLRA